MNSDVCEGHPSQSSSVSCILVKPQAVGEVALDGVCVHARLLQGLEAVPGAVQGLRPADRVHVEVEGVHPRVVVAVQEALLQAARPEAQRARERRQRCHDCDPVRRIRDL